MNKKEFLSEHPLHLSWPEQEAKIMRQILEDAGESHGFKWTEEKTVVIGDTTYYDFCITPLTTNYASLFYHLGIKVGEKIIPVWNKRTKK